ncbi:MAG: hypothetical protein AABY09_02955, partial [Nanoarchaeota archaeon]
KIIVGEPKQWNVVGKEKPNGAWIAVEKGAASMGPALTDVDKEVVQKRKDIEKSNPKMISGRRDKVQAEFSINISSAVISVPYGSNRDSLYIYKLPEKERKEGGPEPGYYERMEGNKLKFGWDLYPSDYLWAKLTYNSKGDKVPMMLDIYAYGHLAVLHSAFESTIRTNLVSVTNTEKTVYYKDLHGIVILETPAGAKYNSAAFLDTQDAFESCRTIYTYWEQLTCIYLNAGTGTISFFDKPKSHNTVSVTPSMGIRGDAFSVKKVVIEPVTKEGRYKIIDKNFAGKWLHVDRVSAKLERTTDWKDMGISFTVFPYNEKLKAFQRLECSIDTGKCTLDGKEISGLNKNVIVQKCGSDSECGGRKCIGSRCVAPTRCEPLYENRGSKFNVVFVAIGYDSKDKALAEVKSALDYDGKGKGLMSFEPLKSFKSSFSFYFIEEALARDGNDNYDTNEIRKSCNNAEVVIFDNTASTCNDYCPKSMYGKIQLPTKKSFFTEYMPSVLAHEAGHYFGLLDDEYRSSDASGEHVNSKFISATTGDRYTIHAVNCVPCYRAQGVWLPKSGSLFKGCGGECAECKGWCRPTDNSIMNNKFEYANFYSFNDASYKQYSFIMRRRLGLPKDSSDLEFEKWIDIARYGKASGGS